MGNTNVNMMQVTCLTLGERSDVAGYGTYLLNFQIGRVHFIYFSAHLPHPSQSNLCATAAPPLQWLASKRREEAAAAAAVARRAGQAAMPASSAFQLAAEEDVNSHLQSIVRTPSFGPGMLPVAIPDIPMLSASSPSGTLLRRVPSRLGGGGGSASSLLLSRLNHGSLDEEQDAAGEGGLRRMPSFPQLQASPLGRFTRRCSVLILSPRGSNASVDGDKPFSPATLLTSPALARPQPARAAADAGPAKGGATKARRLPRRNASALFSADSWSVERPLPSTPRPPQLPDMTSSWPLAGPVGEPAPGCISRSSSAFLAMSRQLEAIQGEDRRSRGAPSPLQVGALWMHPHMWVSEVDLSGWVATSMGCVCVVKCLYCNCTCWNHMDFVCLV